MRDVYGITSPQKGGHRLTRTLRNVVVDVPLLPGSFPDYSAPIVRTAADGAR
jgi:hypothetical protein